VAAQLAAASQEGLSSMSECVSEFILMFTIKSESEHAGEKEEHEEEEGGQNIWAGRLYR
jgi:hypothetical protein